MAAVTVVGKEELDTRFTSATTERMKRIPRWTGAHWSWWAHVLNLTDEKYAERVSYGTAGREYDAGVPRTFYAGLSYQW